VTGLIYVVIIALWAAVLIPMWLRRHDQISEVRSTLRFSSAMRTLGRETRGSSPTASPVTVAGDASRRRVTILAILSSVFLVALGLTMLGSMSMGVVVIAALPLIGYVVAMVVTSAQRRETAAPRRRRPAPEPSARAPRTARPVRPRGMSLQDELDEFAQWDPWEEDDGSWQAVPTTLPTYVSAPRASQVPREIDRVSGGDWSGEAMVSAARRMRRPRITVDDLSDERYGVMPARDIDATAEIPAVRRVVNE
jgi:hypothetical protein